MPSFADVATFAVIAGLAFFAMTRGARDLLFRSRRICRETIPRQVRRAGKAAVLTTFSLKTTAAAWTVGEVTGRTIDAGWLHMPSVNSARAFLAVFGLVLLFETANVARSIDWEAEEHVPEKRPPTLVTQRIRDDETDDERGRRLVSLMTDGSE